MVEQGRPQRKAGVLEPGPTGSEDGEWDTSVLVSTIKKYIKHKGSEEASQWLGEVIPGKGNRSCKGRH